MIYNFLQALFGTNARPDLHEEKQVVAAPVVEESSSSAPKLKASKRVPDDFSADVDAIQKKYGKFSTGRCIEAKLQDLLLICPRKRPRIDAYQKLIDFLAEKYDVNLIIKSRKTK